MIRMLDLILSLEEKGHLPILFVPARSESEARSVEIVRKLEAAGYVHSHLSSKLYHGHHRLSFETTEAGKRRVYRHRVERISREWDAQESPGRINGHG